MFVHTRDLVEHLQDVLHCLRHRAVRQEHERVSLARRVGLGNEECLNEFRRIGDEVLKFAVDRVDGEDGILPDVGVTVLETGSTDGDEGLENLNVFGNLLEETQCCSSNILIWMLLVTSPSNI